MLLSQLTHTVVHNWYDVISGAQFPKFTAGRNERRLRTQSVIFCCCRSMERSPFSGCSCQTEEFSLLYEQLTGSTKKKKKIIFNRLGKVQGQNPDGEEKPAFGRVVKGTFWTSQPFVFWGARELIWNKCNSLLLLLLKTLTSGSWGWQQEACWFLQQCK